MRLLTRRTLERFADQHASARQALADFCGMVELARWRDAEHLRASSTFPARSIGCGRFIFNIKGNEVRVIVEVRYADESKGYNGIVRVCFVGTHAEYDRIDARTVMQPHP